MLQFFFSHSWSSSCFPPFLHHRRFQIPQSARNAINQGASAPQSRDAKDSPSPFVTGNANAATISALEKEVLRASKLAMSKQHNPTTPLVSAGSGPFSPRVDHK